jgi:hypothetical protein
LNENSLVCVNKNSEVQNNELFVKGEFLNDPTFKLGSDEYFGSKPEYFEQTKVYHETDEEEEDVDIEAGTVFSYEFVNCRFQKRHS